MAQLNGGSLAGRHQLRAGLLIRGGREQAEADTITFGGSGRGAIVSDELRASEALSITAKLRFDHLVGRGRYWQPRFGASLLAQGRVSLHGGYARTILHHDTVIGAHRRCSSVL